MKNLKQLMIYDPSSEGYVNLEMSRRLNVFFTPKDTMALQKALRTSKMKNKNGSGFKLELKHDTIVLAGYANSMTVTLTVHEYLYVISQYVQISDLEVTKVFDK